MGKLTNVTKVALLSCETVEECITLLNWATREGSEDSSRVNEHLRGLVKSLQEQQTEAQHAIVTLQHANEALKLKHDEKVMGERIPRQSSDVDADMVKELIKEKHAHAEPFSIMDVAEYFQTSMEVARNRVYYLWHGCGTSDPWPFFRENFKPKRVSKHYVYYPNNMKHETVARVVAMGTATGYTMPVNLKPDEVSNFEGRAFKKTGVNQ